MILLKQKTVTVTDRSLCMTIRLDPIKHFSILSESTLLQKYTIENQLQQFAKQDSLTYLYLHNRNFI